VALALAHQRHRPPPLPSDVPKPVRALVEQAMAKDARTRPAAVALAGYAVMARAALLEERRRGLQGGGNGWPGGDGLPGIGGWPIVSSLASTNGWSSGHGNGNGSQHTQGLRAQAHTSDPEQETGEWAPVWALLTRGCSRRRRPLAVTAMLAVLAVLVSVLTAATAQRVPTITVPSVSGQPITTAGQLLVRAGFQVRERTQPNRSVKAGIVLAQDPAAGTRLERGAVVTLTVSTGPAAVAVDPADYLGQPLDIVRTALIRLGLQLAIAPAPAGGAPGTVVGIAPSGALRQGDTVTITVALPPRESSASTGPSSDGWAPLIQAAARRSSASTPTTTATAGTGDVPQRGVKRLGAIPRSLPQGRPLDPCGGSFTTVARSCLDGRVRDRCALAASIGAMTAEGRGSIFPGEASDGRRRERPWAGPPPGVARLNRAQADRRMFCQPSGAPGRHLVGPSAGQLSRRTARFQVPRANYGQPSRRVPTSTRSRSDALGCRGARIACGCVEGERASLCLVCCVQKIATRGGGVPDPNASAVLR
jgi:hypothetical protein